MGKLIDADEFVEWLMSDAITDEQRKFAEQVKYAADRMKPAQPGCEDAVSRADVDILIEEAQTAWLRGDILLMYPALKKGLQKVPSVTPKQPGWIPVTERLPTENNSYLVWMPFTPEGHHITVAEWCGSYWNIKTPIMAWMPLPTPWEGGQDESSD